MSKKEMLFLMIQIILMTYTVSSIKICSNETQTGREVILDKLYDSGGSCGCSVKLIGGEDNSLVTFQTTSMSPGGCQYKLIFNLNTETREYSCFNYETPYQFNMSSTDILYVNLTNDRNDTSDFVFSLNIQTQTNDSQLNLTCSSPWTNPLVTTTEKPTAITQRSTTLRDNNIHYTSTTDTSGESESTETTDRSKTTEESQNSDLPVIVGCTVGGVVLVCVVVVIVICLLKRRKQKDQVDQNLSDQNLTDGNVHSNNIYDNSSQTQHQNTVDRNSYSDCYDHIPNDSLQIRNKNQVVIMSNNNTDSLDNDDYSRYEDTASEHYEHVPDQLEHVQDQLERVPNTDVEYAVVQKKPKKSSNQDKSFELNNSRNKKIVHDDYENVGKDNLDLKREINRIVGPKGDDYALVNKC